MQITLRPMTDHDVGAVRGIADQQLGPGYIDEADLHNTSNEVQVAIANGTVVGFCIARPVRLEDIYRRIAGLREKHLRFLDDIQRVGLLASVATHPVHTGIGIGTALVRHCVEMMESHGLHIIIASAWKSDHGVHIGSLLEKQGFEPVMQVDDFWKEESQLRRYTCPVCGNPPCRCKAVIYIRKN